MATKKMPAKVVASAKRVKRNKQPTQYNPNGVRVMILREGKVKWGWEKK